MDALRIEHLTKSFGKTKVLDDVSLNVPRGSLFGLIGENGAGKTTTMKLVLGLLKADSGQIMVVGEPVHFGQTKTNRLVGYLPDVPQFYSYMRAGEYLRLCGQIAGLPGKQIAKRGAELLELVGLSHVNKKIGAFSRGMKQRLGVAQALVNQPQLLICDEPTSALDPVGRKAVLDLLSGLRGTTTVIFSTHVLSDVERICDRAAVLHKGQIKLEGTLAELKARHGPTGLTIEFANLDDTSHFCAMIAPELIEQHSQTEVSLRTAAPQFELWVLRLLSDCNIVPIRFELESPSIENLFLEAVA